jgi:hypothetical protein
MPRVCTICADERSEDINVALVQRISYRKIAQQYGVSYNALHRHAHDHIPALIARAFEAEERAEGGSLLSRVEDLQARTLAILSAAEETEDHRIALSAIREARGNLQLIGEVTKDLDRQPILNITLSAEWVEIRGLIIGALEAYPGAREAVLRALEDGSNGTG